MPEQPRQEDIDELMKVLAGSAAAHAAAEPPPKEPPPRSTFCACAPAANANETISPSQMRAMDASLAGERL